MLDIASLYRFSYFRYSNLPFIMVISGCWNVWYLCFWWLGHIKCTVFQSTVSRPLNWTEWCSSCASCCVYLCTYVILSYSDIRFYLFIFKKIQNVLLNQIHTPCCEINVIRVYYYSIKLNLKMFSFCVIQFVTDKALISCCKLLLRYFYMIVHC